jgi:CheY-like chemotaxis protein
MGGTLELESSPGAGATFRAVVPLAWMDRVAEPGAGAPDLRGKTVLIVSQSDIEAGLTARRLRAWGADVCRRSAVDAGCAVLAQGRPDAILVDHAIGAPAIELLLAAAGEAVANRIVLVTPAARQDLPALHRAGFTGYLIKPIRAASLAARLQGGNAFEPAALSLSASDTVPDVTGVGAAGLAVLVAEDNEINALLVRSLLGRLGHRPTMVSDGAAAVSVWRSAAGAGTPFDLVLMDIHMPGLDGIAATRQIRLAEAGSSRHTPIVALTANALGEERDLCLSAGMDDFITKPLDRDRLTTLIASLHPASLVA